MRSTKIILTLLFVSLVINVCAIYILKTQSVTDVVTVTDGVERNYLNVVYDLSNYKSTSYESKNLQQRLDRLYSEYERDKKIPKEEYYSDGEIDPAWARKCVNSLRRISVITAKIEVVENIVNNLVKNDMRAKQEFDIMIERNGYHEKLMDMSNFYAQFISDEMYNVIQTTLD